MPQPLLKPSCWLGAAAFHEILEQSGYGLPRRLAALMAGDDASTETAEDLMAFWYARGDAFMDVGSSASDTGRAAFDAVIETRHPLELRHESLPQAALNAFFLARSRTLREAALSEAAERRVPPLDLVDKASVRAMLIDEAADHGLKVIRKGPHIRYPAVVLELPWGGGGVAVAFDTGGRQALAGSFPFEFFITYDNGDIVWLGDLRHLLPGVNEYFVFASGSINAEGVFVPERSPTLMAYGVRVAMDLPRMLVQTFQPL